LVVRLFLASSRRSGFRRRVSDVVGPPRWHGREFGVTKRLVIRLDEAEVKRQFPLADLVPDWFFRINEISNGGYKAEGTDLWGRQVSRSGSDPDVLLVECAKDAQRIIARLNERGGGRQPNRI
jgi:hypothetical protein